MRQDRVLRGQGRHAVGLSAPGGIGHHFPGLPHILLRGDGSVETVFPRDLYRVIVVDKSGERARDEIYINSDPVDFETLAFPTSQVEENRIIISGDNPEHIIWFYDLEDNQIKLFATQERDIPVDSVLNARELQIAKRYYIYTFDSTRGYGLIYGPVNLP